MLRKFFLLASLSLPLSAFSTPSISKVSVTSDGAYIEIWGSNFGTKTNVKPLVWMDYESDSDPALYRVNMTAIYTNGQIVTDPKNSSNKTLSYNMTKSPSESAAGPGGIPFAANKLYVNIKRYYDFSIDDTALLVAGPSGLGGFNLKPFRLWSDMNDAKQSIRHNLLLGYQGNEGVNSARITAEYTENYSDWPDIQFPFQGRQWINQEILYASSDLNVANGYMKLYQNGHYTSSRPIVTINTGHPELYSNIYFDQLSNFELNNPTVVYYDDMYIDDTFSRVTLQDNQNSSTHNDSLPLIPVIWQDTYIKVKITHSAKLKPNYFVFVFDAANTSNSQGVRYMCDRCPKPPAPIN